MRVVNAARHVAVTATTATDKNARTSLLVVFKATYGIPVNGRPPRPLLPPQPVAMQDVFSGEPGLSAPLYENDFAAAKTCCDVLFDAVAHVPDGIPRTHLDVAVRVGGMAKALRVIGDRTWEKDLMLLRAGRPAPFTSMPLHAGRAFGGVHTYMDGDEQRWDVFESNPFGHGYARARGINVHGLPLPNLEAPGTPVRHPQDGTPAALSILPRNAPSRVRFAGTYDQHWHDEIAPFLPPDFDERFFQSAPEDQRIPFPTGGEEVTLVNLVPGRPEVFFRLPRLDVVPVRVLHSNYSVSVPHPNVDTLFFEPDEGRFSVVWRVSVPLGVRGIREVRLVAVGEVCQQWWHGVSSGGTGCHGCAAHARLVSEKAEASAKTPVEVSSPASSEALSESCPDEPEGPLMPTVRIVRTDTSGGEA